VLSGAAVNWTTDNPNHDLRALVATIARSQIVVAATPAEASRFPAGFDAVDLAILEWIAREGRSAGRALLRM
jgi:hypothetical protein